MEEKPERSSVPVSRHVSAGKSAGVDFAAQELDREIIGKALEEVIADESLTVSPTLKRRMTRLFHEYFTGGQAGEEQVVARIREFSNDK